jgi:hypothetical protein
VVVVVGITVPEALVALEVIRQLHQVRVVAQTELVFKQMVMLALPILAVAVAERVVVALLHSALQVAPAAPASSSYKFPILTQPHSLPALHPLSAHLSLALTPIP